MEKDITKTIAGYLKYWYLFLIGSVICLSLAFLNQRYNVVPEYYVGGKILLNDKEGGGNASGLSSLNDLGLIKMSKNIQDEIGILKSYDLMRETVEELNMEVGYYMKGRVNEIEVYGKKMPFRVQVKDSASIYRYGTVGSVILVNESTFKLETEDSKGNTSVKTYSFGEEIMNASGAFSIELNPESNDVDFSAGKPVIIRFQNIENVARGYNYKLGIYPVDKNGGGLLEIGVTDVIPQRGVDLINTLIEVYARESAEHKNQLAKTTLKLIDERLDLLTDELGSAEKNVEVYKQSNQLTDVGSDAARFVQMADETDRELFLLRTQINALNSLEAAVAQINSQSFSAINSYNIQNPVIGGLIGQYNEQFQRRQSLIRSSGAGNPQLVEIDRQLQDLKNAILGNIQSVKSVMQSEQNILQSKSSGYRNRVSTVPTAERALLEINRDQGLKQSLYLYLLQKREEESLSLSSPFADTRIIEQPRASSGSMSNNVPVYLGALLFGLFVPFAFIFVKDKLNTKILSVDDIKESTDTVVLGSIVNSPSKEAVVVSENNVTPIAELFRLMRHNLKFVSQGKPNQVIMVTSGKQGEGKTFVSINLGVTLAITGKKVVILGFDLRAPKLMSDLGLSYTSGITDYIVDNTIQVKDIVVPYQKQNNLFFIGSGAVPLNPGELIIHERVGELIENLKKVYDYIIIDTPPIGRVSDAFSLGRFTDLNLFVTRYNFTKKEELNVINEITENKKLSPLMIVFNAVKLEKSGAYSYGYGAKKK